MNKIYSVGDIVYYNDPYFERLGIEIEILKVHKIKDTENDKGYIYYYSAKRLDGVILKDISVLLMFLVQRKKLFR